MHTDNIEHRVNKRLNRSIIIASLVEFSNDDAVQKPSRIHQNWNIQTTNHKPHLSNKYHKKHKKDTLCKTIATKDQASCQVVAHCRSLTSSRVLGIANKVLASYSHGIAMCLITSTMALFNRCAFK
jgi:hypothetical protein